MGIYGDDVSHEATELTLFIENDADLYRQQMQPIQKNLVTKMARGLYDKSKAEKLWMYLAESGAKKYVKEFGSGGEGEWHRMFPVSVRKEVARILNDSFVVEASLGNYSRYLPKKYAGWKPSGSSAGGKKRHAAPKRPRLYVGKKNDTQTFEVFSSSREPTQSSHGKKYGYSIGPFRTRAGADIMAQFGQNNPHLQTVAAAEKMARASKPRGGKKRHAAPAKKRGIGKTIAEVRALLK